jgi:hypothetical protein
VIRTPCCFWQAVKVGTYAEALAAWGGGRPGQSVQAAGVPAKRPGWHSAGPDVVKFIETTTPGTEVNSQPESIYTVTAHT